MANLSLPFWPFRASMSVMRISEVGERFVLQLRANGRSENTVLQYERHLLLLARWVAGEGLCGDLEGLDHGALAQFLASPLALSRSDGRSKKASSMNALRSSVRGFFGYLHRAGYAREDASRLVRRALCAPSLPRSLSEPEQERLLAVLAKGKGPAASRDYVLFGFLLSTGVRLGSALALDVADLDFEAGEVTLRTCKGGREQRVFLGHAIVDHLRQYVGERRAGLLFPGQAGGKLSPRHVQRRLSIWLKAAGIERRASPHSLRHTYATALYKRTGDVLLVQRALGHRSISSTVRYAEISDERLRAAVAS